MPNITLSVDENVIRKVRRIAVDRDTTLTGMVREFLQTVADSDAPARRQAAGRLERTFEGFSRNMGTRSWTREDLHER